MKDYFSCNFFNSDFKISSKFEVLQDEIVYVGGKHFKKIANTYRCQWVPNEGIRKELPFVLIPIKNNSNLIKYVFTNFKNNKFYDFCNIILIDDRSKENLQKIAKQFNVSYLRIDNNKGFNFSMLNNIAALVSHKLGAKEIVLWNSDLWLEKIEHFHSLMEKHKNSFSTISGSKLLYPLTSVVDGDSVNIKNHFPSKGEGEYKGKVQFGGVRWAFSGFEEKSGQAIYLPVHYKRFADKKDPCVNCEMGTEFVTGALQVIDLEWFIKIGGLNPSLSKVYQDVDLCLRAIEDSRSVMYFGKNMHFYHDESYNHFSNDGERKVDDQFVSDSKLFNKIWSKKIHSLIF